MNYKINNMIEYDSNWPEPHKETMLYNEISNIADSQRRDLIEIGFEKLLGVKRDRVRVNRVSERN